MNSFGGGRVQDRNTGATYYSLAQHPEHRQAASRKMERAFGRIIAVNTVHGGASCPQLLQKTGFTPDQPVSFPPVFRLVQRVRTDHCSAECTDHTGAQCFHHPGIGILFRNWIRGIKSSTARWLEPKT